MQEIVPKLRVLRVLRGFIFLNIRRQMDKLFCIFVLAITILNCAGQPETSRTENYTRNTAVSTTTNESYFLGNGGKGISLAVLLPTGNDLSSDEQWLLSLIQGSITGDFNKYSAMTVIDRFNIEKIIENQQFSASGYFSDDDFISIGKLANARYILTGSITKTPASYMLEFAITEAELGIRRASYPPRQVSWATLENLSAIKEASADLLEQLGVSLTDKGKQELKSAVSNSRLQAEEALAKGLVARRQGNEVAALIYFDHAIEIDSNLSEAYMWRGIMYYDKGDNDNAIANFTQAIRLDQNNAVIYGFRGNAYYRKKNYNSAIDNYTQTIRLAQDDETSVATYLMRGLSYFNKEDYNRAITDFTQLIRINPNEPRAYYFRGDAYLGKGDYDRAITDYTQTIRLKPNDVEAYYSRGVSYIGKRDFNRAITDFEAALRINPNHTDARNGLETARQLRGR
jgi:tetratricopeptide (TPR) repeat protein